MDKLTKMFHNKQDEYFNKFGERLPTMVLPSGTSMLEMIKIIETCIDNNTPWEPDEETKRLLNDPNILI